MTMTNGSDPNTQWLDQALAGQEAEVKARVLEIILKYKIDPENEFFVIFVALGQLQVLVEDSPQEWQHLFQSFQQELEQWTQTNLSTLEVQSQEAETVTVLAHNTKKLSGLMKRLVNTCLTLTKRLQASNETLQKSIAILDSLNQSLQLQGNRSKTAPPSDQQKLITNLSNTLNTLAHTRQNTTMIGSVSSWLLVINIMTLIGVGYIAHHQMRLTILQSEFGQALENKR
ncbi:hypothetical protein Pse7367_3748 (plasmid) [Thalassoporum mexicanum PCC 7367]|uniref:DUF6753 family protein n=1 Tax=Thalassoporum mexicanum TaxID=3457544 RepID=UPI00029FF1DB|nr:DUF6753 family protein [Pseudanabaena sp. PCC 7367]AFY71974.1 hypothetical protein Pse7367_3748 [Pseudanabaena sp. PCC 7367]